MTATTYAPYVEPPKVAQKMSFYSEEHAAKLAAIPVPEDWAVDAARRVVAAQPDGDRLTQIIFGDKP